MKIQPHHTTTILILIATILIGSTSAFAEKALPNEPLYKVKVNVNEKVASLFSLSSEEKAEWKERLVERRLDEIQKLATQNKLDEQTRLEIEESINKSIDEFTIALNQIDKDVEGSKESSNINIRLQASILAYKNVLQKQTENPNTQTTTKNELANFLKTLDQGSQKIVNDNLNNDITDNSTNIPTIEDKTESVEKKSLAQDLLKSLKLLYQKEKNNLSQAIQSQIEEELALIEKSLTDGNTAESNADYKTAIDKYSSVINDTNNTKLLLLANTIKNKIESDDDDDGDYDIDREDDREEIKSPTMKVEDREMENEIDDEEFDD